MENDEILLEQLSTTHAHDPLSIAYTLEQSRDTLMKMAIDMSLDAWAHRHNLADDLYSDPGYRLDRPVKKRRREWGMKQAIDQSVYHHDRAEFEHFVERLRQYYLNYYQSLIENFRSGGGHVEFVGSDV